MTRWTSLVSRNSTEFKFVEFIDSFIHTVAGLLSSQNEPRISAEIKRVLHLSEKTKTGHWYLYQNYTKIRVYGCKIGPYKIPKYVSMSIFSLEYIRKMISMDEIHFVSGKRKSQYKIKTQVGPFIYNTRTIIDVVDSILRKFNFQASFTWAYDPFNIISRLRVELKTTPYNHTPRPEIENFIN